MASYNTLLSARSSLLVSPPTARVKTPQELERIAQDAATSGQADDPLTGSDGVNLQGVILQDGNLPGATLRGANLSSLRGMPTTLRNADLQDADLRGADLTGAQLSNALIVGASF